MNFDEIYNDVEHISGWLGKQDAQVLYKYASQVTGKILEIGCYAGKSTRILALSSPDSKIITVDPFVLGDANKVKSEFYGSTWGLNVELINSYSYQIAKGWKDEVDLIFIDGEHTYKAVKKDIEMFAGYLKSGGFMLAHDYTLIREYPGVKKAVQELKDKYFESVVVESGIACCKKK